jgi:beta-glucosidase
MLLLLLACSADRFDDPVVLAFPAGFRWGAAGAAHQVEGGNTNNIWSQFETLPEFAGLTTEPSGEAVRGWDLYETDADLAEDLGSNVYRLSIEWSRVEPSRGVWDEAAWAHYGDVIDALRARGIEPMVTLHHFTEPIWTHDLRDVDCVAGPSDTNLCGWANPEMATAFARFATEAATRLGDRVDTWTTFNEPMSYFIGGYVGGSFPPGKSALTTSAIQADAFPVLRGMLDGHAAAYAALHAADGVDADGDGTAAVVGFTNAMSWVEPLDPGDPADVAAADRVQALYGYSFPDATIRGLLDADLDGVPEEAHPEWAGTVDQLGYQYYFRFAVKAAPGFPPLDALPCDPTLLAALGLDPATLGCPVPDPADVTQMGYEHYPPGIRLLGEALADRYPGVPLRVTENGIATTTGVRRAESIVRHLVELHAAIEEGVPVDGYVHWSLTDNFEWAEGFRPKFGLYAVDLATYTRTPTEGATVFADIIHDDGIRRSILDTWDGEHLTPGE